MAKDLYESGEIPELGLVPKKCMPKTHSPFSRRRRAQNRLSTPEVIEAFPRSTTMRPWFM